MRNEQVRKKDSVVMIRWLAFNGLSVNVNGYNAQNDNDLADTVVHRINESLNDDDKVWGR